MSRRKTFSFSLVELLVVMGIMVVLMLIAIPVFRRMTQLNRVDQMAANIKLGLEQARSAAAAERRPVAVIFTTDGNSRFRNGGYRLAYMDNNGDWDSKRNGDEIDESVPLTPVAVQDTGKWRNAPDGAMLLWVDTAAPDWEPKSVAGFTSPNYAPMTAGGGVPNLPDSAGSTFYKITFTPRGGLRDINNDLYLYVAEAAFDGSGNVIFPNAENDETGNYVAIKVAHLSGRVSFERATAPGASGGGTPEEGGTGGEGGE